MKERSDEMAIASTRLLDCPCCGSKDVVELGWFFKTRIGEPMGWRRFYVGCHHCGLSVGAIGESEDAAKLEAYGRWNHRQSSASLSLPRDERG